MEVQKGRWVIVLEGGSPILYGSDRDVVTAMFVAIREVCPAAQLVWESAGDADHVERLKTLVPTTSAGRARGN